jgi:hypothetical protein
MFISVAANGSTEGSISRLGTSAFRLRFLPQDKDIQLHCRLLNTLHRSAWVLVFFGFLPA